MEQQLSKEEGNAVIAKFMGLIRKEPDSKFNLPQYWAGDKNDGRKKGDFVGYPHQLKYHSSWDWLKMVIDKISQWYDDEGDIDLLNKMDEANLSIFTMTVFANIETVWKSVIQFIQWHNQQPQQPSK